MIGFNCQHCGHFMRADDRHAGRDGCCKACNQFIVVPMPDGTGGDVSALSFEERCGRAERLLAALARKTTLYAELVMRCRDEHGQLAAPSDETPGTRDEVEQLRAQVTEASQALAAKDEALTESGEEVARAWYEAERLRAQVTEASAAVASKDEALVASGDEVAQAQEEVERLRAQLEEVSQEAAALRSAEEAVREALEEREEQLAEAQKAREEADRTLACREEEWSSEMALVRSELATAQDALAETKAEIERFNGELGDAAQTAPMASSEAGEHQAQLEEATLERDEERAASRRAEDALREVQAQLEDAQAQVQALTAELEALSGGSDEGPQSMASDLDEDEEIVAAVPEVIDSGDTRVEQALTQAYLRFLNPS